MSVLLRLTFIDGDAAIAYVNNGDDDSKYCGAGKILRTHRICIFNINFLESSTAVTNSLHESTPKTPATLKQQQSHSDKPIKAAKVDTSLDDTEDIQEDNIIEISPKKAARKKAAPYDSS